MPESIGNDARKDLGYNAVPSPMPSKMALAPRVPAMKRGKSAWIISEEMSIKRLTKPSTHTVRGILILIAGRSDDMAAKQSEKFRGHYLLGA